MMINEKLLQFIWEHQYYNHTSLVTEDGAPLSIISPGKYNRNQGPDFSEARIKVHDTVWAGHIELHVVTSDWFRHHHQSDPKYGNTILHVVWRNDLQPGKLNTPNIPVLELQSRVSNLLLKRYEDLMNLVSFVPCERNLTRVSGLCWSTWKEDLVIQRLTRKSVSVHRLLQESRFHWEETLWWMIAKSFGGKLNAESFELLAKSIPLKILGKHKQQVLQIEALLFGQASLLEKRFTEHYPLLLQKEYRFLKKKYSLVRPVVSLQFLRMRPGGFPTIRLAQLASLIQRSNHLFSTIIQTADLPQLRSYLATTANDYWHYHYRFDEPGGYSVKTLGDDMIDHILINCIIPILFAYGNSKNISLLTTRAVDWLSLISAEKNRIVTSWKHLGMSITKACDSQAYIELKTQYCDERRCLECAIGRRLLTATE